MAVASELMPLPSPFFEPDLSSPCALDSPQDSDDDYCYVASLAEQIAHSMLDDDDSHQEAQMFSQHVHAPPFASPFATSLRPQVNDHDIWHPDSKINSSSSHTWKPPNLTSTPLSVPSGRESPTGSFVRSHIHERALQANQASSQNPRSWECISYSRKSEAAVLLMSQTTQAVLDGFLMPAASVAASSFESSAIAHDTASSPQICSLSHIRHDYGSVDLKRRSRPSVGRSRHKGYEMAGVNGASASGRLYAYYIPRQSENAAGGSVLLGYGGARKETIGTGVFLPRPISTGMHHRRKPELGREVAKLPQAKILAEGSVFPPGGYPRYMDASSKW